MTDPANQVKIAPAAESAARHVLDGLAEIGIDYLFANLGTDHVSLIEVIADRPADGRPTLLPIAHENVAMHMAAGYALATGRGQAVLVHVDAGTANAALAAHNLFRGRIPVMLLAGRAPFTLHGELPGSRDNYVHYVQDPFDLRGLVRAYVKWEYDLARGYVAKETLRRAHSVMHSDPPGPVFMTLPREMLAERIDPARVRSFPAAGYGPVAAGGTTPEVVAAIAAALIAANKPVAVTSYLGRNPDAVATLDALAHAVGLRVVEANPTCLNIPRDSRCFAGFEAGPVLAGADLGLLIDVDVPFLPGAAPDADAIRWLQIDVDAAKRAMPMWGFRADLRVEADSAIVLKQVLDAVRATSDAGFEARVTARIAGWAVPTNAGSGVRRSPAAGVPIDAEAVCAAIALRLDPDDIVVNEAIRNTAAVLHRMTRTRPGTYFANAGGGLGYGGGVALGLKLAHPDRRVVQIVGDGSFHLGAPDVVFATARRHRLPILTVVLDNGGWSAVKQATLRLYPNGHAAANDAFCSRLDGDDPGHERRFDRLAEAFGAYGEHVGDAAALPAAIDRALAALDGGRAALLHIVIAPH